MMRKFFPKDKLSPIDWVLGASFLLCCFVLFFHLDIVIVGQDTLNYLFGKPLEFYENAKKFHGTAGYTSYPPSLYVIFALWLYPFKLLGFIDNSYHFPIYLTYWLKLLTTLVYIASAFVFYKIAQTYFDLPKAKYAASAWFVMPLALYSQFIFSQYDIFYVILTMLGFLMFLRGSPMKASIFFGLAITFKYFPAFVFIPLLLFYEKRLSRLIIYLAIFYFPTLLIDLLYGHSTAFIEGVKGHSAIDRVYAAFLDEGVVKIYYLFAGFTLLSGLAFFAEVAQKAQARTAAYLYLVSSILPFLFIQWHPQWLMFFVPAIILTTMMTKPIEKFMLLDLAGMFLFVATIVILYTYHVDTEMFRGGLFFHLKQVQLFHVADIFSKFSIHSANVYLSGFWAYLVLQIILKYRYLFAADSEMLTNDIDYDRIRRSLYVGLLLFLVPTLFVIYKDIPRKQEIKIQAQVDLTQSKKIFDLSDADFKYSHNESAKLEKVDLNTISLEAMNNDPIVILDKTKTNASLTILSIKISSKKKTNFQLFYKEKLDDRYREYDSLIIPIHVGTNDLKLLVPSKYINNKLRVDFVSNSGKYLIEHFEIYEYIKMS